VVQPQRFEIRFLGTRVCAEGIVGTICATAIVGLILIYFGNW
jgi:hypothetical protein